MQKFKTTARALAITPLGRSYKSLALLCLATGLIMAGALSLTTSVRAQTTEGFGGHWPIASHVAPHLIPVVASGEVLTGFGDHNAADTSASDLSSRGVVILAAGGSDVSAPAAGYVEFCGAIGDLGQVVILNLGNDYRVVLTGLGRVNVRKGDVLTAGDLVGRIAGTGKQTSHLYMELRHGETPVDPSPTTLIAMR